MNKGKSVLASLHGKDQVVGDVLQCHVKNDGLAYHFTIYSVKQCIFCLLNPL